MLFLPARMWSVVESTLLPVTAPISLHIARSKLVYFYFADVTGFCSPSLSLFAINILRDPTTGGRVFYLPKKIQVKEVSCRNFSNPLNDCPIYFVTH